MKHNFICLLFHVFISSVYASGPGIEQRQYSEEELFTPLGRFASSKPGYRGHASVGMFHGYLVGLEARDSGLGDGAIAFFDISDPANPKRVATHEDENTKILYEGHNYGYTTVEGKDIVCMVAQKGIQLWDWTDIQTPKHISSLDLAQLTKGAYVNTAWWTALQFPYVYVGATNAGVYIIDVSDLEHPKFIKRLSADQVGGFKVGSLYACGNLLVCNSFDGPGISLLDISQPTDPKILKVIKQNFGYSGLFNGGFFYGISEIPLIWDLRDPSTASKVSHYEGPKLGSKGGYGVIQDNYLHMGVSDGYAKVDISDPTKPHLVDNLTMNIKRQDFDGAHVIGNLVAMTCDHGTGSYLVPHQKEPDQKAPEVNYINPANGATAVALTSRIGMTFTDEIDHSQLTGATVRELGGNAVKGHWSLHNAILNFSPAQPLRPGCTYQVELPKGIIRDYAGNGMAETYQATFSTGEQLSDWTPEIASTDATTAGKKVHFSLKNNPSLDSYEWDFGDGHQGTGATVNHVYDKPGRYVVSVSVTDGERKANGISHQIIYGEISEQKPQASSTTAYAESTGKIWTVNADNGSVSIVDTHDLKLLAEVQTGGNPRTLALSGDSCFVVDQTSASIVELDASNYSIKRSIPLHKGTKPFGLVIDRAGKRAWVSCEAIGRLYEVDLESGTSQVTLDKGTGFRGIALSADESQLYVTQFLSEDTAAKVYQISLLTGDVNSIDLAIDLGPDTEDSARGLPNYLSQILISPDGSQAWVPSKKDNIQRGLTRDGLPLNFENTVRTIVSAIDLTSSKEIPELRCDFNDTDMANAAVFSPLGDLLFVACQGSNSVEVIDAYTGQHMTSILHVGSAPQGLILDGQGQLYVHNFLGRSLSVFDVNEILKHGTGYAKPLGKITTVTKEVMPANVLRGKKIFYHAADARMSLDGYMSCASCHLDGGHDGRIWDFSDRGEGLRNTVSLLGTSGPAHGNIHWSANFDEVQDFEGVIRDRQGGTGFIQGELRHHPLGAPLTGKSQELDDLAAFVDSLTSVGTSPHRANDLTLTNKGQLGKQLFLRQGCADCHGGTEFTDSATKRLHDVGTISKSTGNRLGSKLLGLDTPSLKGLWNTAPYFHDGSAKSIKDVLRHSGSSEKHGRIGTLTETEIDQLAEYLLQIDDHELGNTPYKLVTNKDTVILSPLHLASLINQADQNVSAIPPISTTLKRELPVKEGYIIQSALNSLMIKRYGAVSGYKLAYASAESQRAWGMDAPAFGAFYEKRYVPNKGSVNADTFIGFHIESEIAFTVKRDIKSRVKNIEDTMRYIETVHVGLDVPDLRYDVTKGKVTAGDVVAMGCGAHTYVIGKGVKPNEVDFPGMTVSLNRNGTEVYTGVSSSTMGDPREAFRLLINSLHKAGTPLKKGQVVLVGSVAKAYVPKEPSQAKGLYIGKATGLPPVTLEVK